MGTQTLDRTALPPHDIEAMLHLARFLDHHVLKYLDNKPVYPIYRTRNRSRSWGPLTGRVSLVKGQSEDDAEFYVGPEQAEWQGVYVVSWAAPAAEAFFGRERRWNDQYIRVRRRFNAKQESIVGFSDEWVTRQGTAPFPVAARRPLPRPGHAPSTSVPQEPFVPPTEDELREASLAAAEQDNANREDYLRKAMLAPRTGTLESVLSTLQPDQYELVTSPVEAPLTIQGAAGTGKSVIATHRAAWLTHPEREGGPVGSLLLVGPTKAWAEHMAPAIHGLAVDDRAILTWTLGEVLADELGLSPDYSYVDSPRDHGARICWLVDLVLADIRKHYGSVAVTPKDLYGTVRKYRLRVAPNASAATKSMTEELTSWQQDLPATYTQALQEPQLWAALAYMSVCVTSPARYDHMIIDEAQDIRPLEWRILGRLCRGEMTILGDLNQRRSDDGVRDWAEISTHVRRTPWTESRLEAGYRSTQSIMDFANVLLPESAHKRSHSILGRGVPPRVVDVRRGRHTIEVQSLEEARLLSARYPGGIVGMLCSDVETVRRVAKSRRWNRTDDLTWKSPVGNIVWMMDADECRGLEFDAGVVVEPAGFRRDGRSYGELYTALTRANRELVVVHEKALPAALARAAEAVV